MAELEPGADGFYDVNHNTIFTKKPRSWCDFERIETVEHEFLHAMGYEHSKGMRHGKCEPLTGGNYKDY